MQSQHEWQCVRRLICVFALLNGCSYATYANDRNWLPRHGRYNRFRIDDRVRELVRGLFYAIAVVVAS